MKTIKIPKLFKSKKKLRASTAARRPLRMAAATNYDDITEPNMKLSRALLIVLLLHVVAVAGIIAFNAMKTRQGIPSVAAASDPAVQAAKPITKVEEPAAPAVTKTENKSHSTARAAEKEDKLPASSGKTYVVAKGDNPVTIARKFKVLYDDLLAINHIDDPRKLQIGQKILIPTRSSKGKKASE